MLIFKKYNMVCDLSFLKENTLVMSPLTDVQGESMPTNLPDGNYQVGLTLACNSETPGDKIFFDVSNCGDYQGVLEVVKGDYTFELYRTGQASSDKISLLIEGK